MVETVFDKAAPNEVGAPADEPIDLVILFVMVSAEPMLFVLDDTKLVNIGVFN